MTLVEETTAPTRKSRLSRVVALAALIVAFILVVYVLFFSGGGGRTYHLLFQNGGQLVSGNQVLVAGQPIGSVDSISLTDNSQADVTVSMDVPLREGTVAVIRTTSLSGVANRYISITPAPNDAQGAAERVDAPRREHRGARRPRSALQHVQSAHAAGTA